jgi:hypothetical protein
VDLNNVMVVVKGLPEHEDVVDGIVADSLTGKAVPRPCEPSGRPLDPVARSWWDAGFKCVGYRVPPESNFKRWIKAVERMPVRKPKRSKTMNRRKK